VIQAMASGPLEGVRVLDLSRYGPGPYCTMILGDMGADVVVVDEAVADGADRRPPMVGPGGPLGTEGSWMRRNCRRIALDLKHPRGRDVAHRLVDRSDVLVESFRPGTVARLGFDLDDLRRRYPRLVVCSISGYGQDGPDRDRAGHDLTYLARGGLLDGNRADDGTPIVPKTVLADLVAGGMHAVIGILAALLARERTGCGQHVDVSLQEGVVGLMAPLLSWLADRRGRRWTLLEGEAPWYRVYRTADARHLVVAAVEPWFWERVCDALQRPEWIALQFDTDHWPKIRAEMAEVIASQPLSHWQAVLCSLDACVEPVIPLSDLFADPHLRARRTFVDVAGAPQVRPLPRLSETPLAVRRGPVAYAADSEAVLAEVGYDEDERAALVDSGVVAVAPARAAEVSGC
jgi:alpha-methylacyl-CoA racemase